VEYVMKLLSLDDILRHPERLANQPPSEILETKIAHAAVGAALAAAESGAAAPAAVVEDDWLSPAEVETAYPTLKRRWLFANADRLGFVRRLSRKRLLVNEAGLKRWLSGRKAH